MAVEDRGTLPVAIDGRRYQADLTRYQREVVPWQRQPVDQGSEGGLATLNTYGAWRRYQSDWTLGAGQRTFDGDGDSRRRSWTSDLLDPWKDDGSLRLLRSPASVRTQTASGVALAAGGDWVFAASGTQVVKSNDTDADAPTWTAYTYSGGAVSALAAGGGYVYVTDGADIYRDTVGGTALAAWSTVNADRMWLANGRLLVVRAAESLGEVYEILSDGTASSTTVKMGMQVEEIVGTPFGIYAVGYEKDGATSGFIKRIPIQSDGALGTAEVAAVLPGGERPLSISPITNYAMIGTTRGVRLAAFSGDGSVTYGPARNPTSDSEDPGKVTAMASLGEHVWALYEAPSGTDAGLVRLGLEEFVASRLAPPFVVERSLTSPGDIVFARDGAFPVYTDGTDVWATSEATAAYETSGTVESGWIGYGVPEEKIPVTLSVRHEALPAGASVKVDLIFEDDTETTVGTSSTQGSVGATYTITASASDRFRVRLTLTGDGTSTPVVTRWALRAVPVPARTTLFSVPLVLRDMVDGAAASGIDVPFDPRAEMDAMETLLEDRKPVTYEEGDSTYRVVVDNVIMPSDDNRAWNHRQRFPQGVVEVRLLTVDG